MPKLWTVGKADNTFSKWIRQRDGRCMFPGCQRKDDTDIRYMQCSHFYSRAEWATRFDPENCDTAHRGCHIYHWEHMKNTGYQDFKIEQLGQERFDAMKKRVDDAKKIGAYVKHSDRILTCMEFLRKENFVDENYRIIKNG